MTDVDDFSPTAKLLVDRDGRTIEEADELLAAQTLQLDVGKDWMHLPGAAAGVLTAVNAGSRAFGGGVRVRLASDAELTSGWARGRQLSEAIEHFGGTLCETLGSEHGTITFGSPSGSRGRIVVHATWSGWSGGVVDHMDKRLDERYGNPLSGALSGAVGVSECFQNVFHGPAAGRRDAGLSLWRPAISWLDASATGPALRYLPDAIWLAGLGHLGQAYAWMLGVLDYPVERTPWVLVQDVDAVSKANLSTSLLAQRSDIGLPKTRLVSRKLESLGFQTSISERMFDADTRRQALEPALVLSGFDNFRSRRALGSAGFELIVDAGLGSGYDRYLNILGRSFLRGFDDQVEYQDVVETSPRSLAPGYQAELDRQLKAGIDEPQARCGVIDLAGRAVGASFVGAVAAAISLAEAMRPLHEGPAFKIVAVDLGFLDGTVATEAVDRGLPRLGYIEVPTGPADEGWLPETPRRQNDSVGRR